MLFCCQIASSWGLHKGSGGICLWPIGYKRTTHMTKQVIRRAGKHLKVCSLASACSDSRVTPIMIMSDEFIPSLQGLPGSMLLRQASAYLILPSYEIPSRSCQ